MTWTLPAPMLTVAVGSPALPAGALPAEHTCGRPVPGAGRWQARKLIRSQTEKELDGIVKHQNRGARQRSRTPVAAPGRRSRQTPSVFSMAAGRPRD
jgi:hypothetical protein